MVLLLLLIISNFIALLEQKYDCRLNFRSRGKYIINDIAIEFGGGGHKLAAGATAKDLTIHEIESKILKLLMKKKKICQ